MCPVDSILDQADIEHFYYHRKFYWTARLADLRLSEAVIDQAMKGEWQMVAETPLSARWCFWLYCTKRGHLTFIYDFIYSFIWHVFIECPLVVNWWKNSYGLCSCETYNHLKIYSYGETEAVFCGSLRKAWQRGRGIGFRSRQVWVQFQAVHLLDKVIDLHEPQWLMYKIRVLIPISLSINHENT